MKTAIAFALVGSAAAVAPSPLARTATSLAGDARSPDGLGVDPGPLVDPLGLLEDTDGFARRRAVEITHGRICMLAFIGMMVQELGITFPGTIDLAGEVPFLEHRVRLRLKSGGGKKEMRRPRRATRKPQPTQTRRRALCFPLRGCSQGPSPGETKLGPKAVRRGRDHALAPKL